jgi:Immunity protein 26
MTKISEKLVTEGAVFGLPLLDYGFAIGVIARRRPGRGNGSVLFGSFFGPRRPLLPTEVDTSKLNKDDAIASICFGGLRIQSGEWPLIGSIEGFERDQWSMPLFGRISVLNPHQNAWLIRYREDYPDGPQDETRVTPEEARLHPPDRGYGADAAARFITELITKKEKT